MLVWDVDRKRRTPLSDNQDRRLPIRAEPLAARSAPNGRTRRALGGSDALRARPPSEPLRGSWFFEKMSCASRDQPWLKWIYKTTPQTTP